MEVEEEVARIMENAPNATAEPPTPRPSAPLPHERHGRDENMPFYLGRSTVVAPKPVRPPRPDTPRPDWSPVSPLVSPFGDHESVLFSRASRTPTTPTTPTNQLPTTMEEIEELRVLFQLCELQEDSQTQGKPDKK